MRALDSDLWLHGLTLGEALRQVAARSPEAEALVFPQQAFRCSYAEYDRLVDEAALALLAMGIETGDRVGVWSTNRPEWVLLQLATARIGAILVTVNPAFRSDELQYVLQQSGMRALFICDRFKASDYYARTTDVVPELTRCRPGELRSAAAPELRWVVAFPDSFPDGMVGWGEMIARGREAGLEETLAARERQLDPGDAINLQYTSGTTGFPKGALLSHRNLLLNGWLVGECQRLGANDRICSPVPLYHCFGCVVGVVASMVHGATLLVPSEYFDPQATLDCIEHERATAIYGVPTMFIAQLEQPDFDDRDLSSLRTGVMAGAPCPVELMQDVIERMGAAQITIGYGLTESSPVATQTRPDDPIELRVKSVGRALPGVEVTIREPQGGDELPLGEQGEICIRGHNVMMGYHQMPVESAQAIDTEGWLHTGDLGVQDGAGYVQVTGRIKDMIIRGGENVYPREIEEALYRYTPVEQVEVVGLPDPRLGEEVCAFVRLHDGAEASAQSIRDHCRQELAHYKVPRYVVFTDEFPTTVSGKVQKYRLREQAVELLASGRIDDARARPAPAYALRRPA